MGNWLNRPQSIEGYEGFVYLIKNNLDGRQYIGKKTFWKRRTLKPLKGKKRKRRTVTESEWKDYYGSSNKLNEDIKTYGKNNFTRTILNCYKSKFEVSYHEAREQFERQVLLTDRYYNELIRVRLHKR